MISFPAEAVLLAPPAAAGARIWGKAASRAGAKLANFATARIGRGRRESRNSAKMGA